MAWPLGTDATNKLKDVLVKFLEGRLKTAPYKARMPKRHIAINAKEGSRRVSASIKVLLYTGADEEPPYEFNLTGGYAIEEMQNVTIDVQADEKGAKSAEVAQVASIIRQIIQSPTERATLIGLGVYNVRESSDALEIDGVDFKRPINFKCTTDTLISI